MGIDHAWWIAPRIIFLYRVERFFNIWRCAFRILGDNNDLKYLVYTRWRINLIIVKSRSLSMGWRICVVYIMCRAADANTIILLRKIVNGWRVVHSTIRIKHVRVMFVKILNLYTTTYYYALANERTRHRGRRKSILLRIPTRHPTVWNRSQWQGVAWGFA